MLPNYFRNVPAVMQPEDLLLSAQNNTIGICPESIQFCSHPHNLHLTQISRVAISHHIFLPQFCIHLAYLSTFTCPKTKFPVSGSAVIPKITCSVILNLSL
jgi:hypothetical protein